MPDAPAPETLGFREFATLLGVKPGYVTELRKAGRLVLTRDGNRVRVAESRRLIEDTRDPAKAGVARRHAAERGADVGAGQGRPAAPPPAAPDAGHPDDEADAAPVSYSDSLAIRRARAQAEREEALARKALRDEQLELGELLAREDVIATVADATTGLRTGLETLPTTLAAQLAAEPTEERCRVLLANAIEHALEELARKCGAVGRSA